MPNLKTIRDPFGDLMQVDLDDRITVKITWNWCSTCQANVEFTGGRWTQWLGEPDKWYCETHK
jgi:hypothetical protein